MTTTKKRGTKKGLGYDDVRAMAGALPGVEEGTSYGTPALKAKGKLLARLREDGETLVVRIEPDARDLLMRSDPETFFVTDHYVDHPWVLVRLPRVERAALAMLLEEGLHLVAPAKPVRAAKPAARPATKAAAPPAVSARPAAKGKGAGSPLDRLRAVCAALPEATESIAHGRPCFQVRGKTFAMFMDDHHGDGRVALWCKAPLGAQGTMVGADPKRFFVPPYVGPRGWIGARLDRDPDWGAVRACLEDAWRMTAPKRLLASAL